MRSAPVVRQHHRGQHPSEPLNSHEERNLVMPHEPSDSCPSLQSTDDRRCPSCQTVKLPEDLLDSAGMPTGCCASRRRRRAAVAHRHRQRALRQVARRAEAGYRTLLAQHLPQGGGWDAA